jgi:AraC-like DNA-binding protein
MSKFRHPDETVRIRSFGVTFRDGSGPLVHPLGMPGWHQLIYATRGVITVHTQQGVWVVPPHRALWIPEGSEHRLEFSGVVALRMLYLRTGRGGAPRDCSVVNITPLMRELIVRTNLIGALDAANPAQRRLIGVIQDELKLLDSVPLQLPWPQDRRGRQFAGLITAAAAGNGVPLPKAVRRCGASRRTLERIFQQETGMALGQWLRREKLLRGLRLLAAGESVDSVALELGYNGASAFIAMFRRELGQTPKRYFGN